MTRILHFKSGGSLDDKSDAGLIGITVGVVEGLGCHLGLEVKSRLEALVIKEMASGVNCGDGGGGGRLSYSAVSSRSWNGLC